ncbi:MAG: hypothetical protein LQ350_007793 [Teloschistes chrysophthalmus]|nr:MAG: hypothetical protein LQ350_007793 [Niorma chrysophthalma]
MSIDIDWEGLTAGPEGLALAESIKDFIHDRFQQVQLPRFIRSVEVHSFDFGKECPTVELKDICDPLPEFYNAQDSSDEELDGIIEEEAQSTTTTARSDQANRRKDEGQTLSSRPLLPIDTHFLRSSTPGIPGGTSNLSYFHLPLSAGLSGTTTPLAAAAGVGPYPYLRQQSPVRQQQQHPLYRVDQLSPPPVRPFHPEDPSSSRRPSTSDSYIIHPPPSSSSSSSKSDTHSRHTQQQQQQQPNPLDTQIVLHISYTGTVRLSLTAEILLDYPMPCFVGIPLQLTITGLSFDGVALLAHLLRKKKAHFCFLTAEDARILIGAGGDSGGGGQEDTEEGQDGGGREKQQPTTVVMGQGGRGGIGGLLKEIRVESAIGRQEEGGKQVLRNVGKVEKFVLEQVRRIFEEEVVWPSFWTFLV